ncbi:MAG: hypothetical protein U9R05_06130, partial [Chloroflexota bacterium]|nr:hypothetical protein [Chloroflexota bacterium]
MMKNKTRLSLIIVVALAVIVLLALLGSLSGVTTAAPIPNPQPSFSTLQSPFSILTYTTIVSETWVTDPISGVQLYTRVLQPDPALYPGELFPAVVLVPGGLG